MDVLNALAIAAGGLSGWLIFPIVRQFFVARPPTEIELARLRQVADDRLRPAWVGTIAGILANSIDPAHQIDELLAAAAEHLACDVAFIARMDGDELVVEGGCGTEHPQRGHALQVDRETIEAGLDPDQTPLLAPAVATRLFAHASHRRGIAWRSPLAAAVRLDGVTWGAIGFARRTERRAVLDQSALDFLRLLADLVAAAVDRREQRQRHNTATFTDPLTGLATRALFDDRLSHAIADAKRNGKLVAVHVLDLDEFAPINGLFGRAAGDALLRQIGHRLQATLREQDTIARIGGDEFAIVQLDPRDPDDATGLARRVIEAIERPFVIGDDTHQITASMGISLYPRDGHDATMLLAVADAAVYEIKHRGRGAAAFSEAAGSLASSA